MTTQVLKNSRVKAEEKWRLDRYGPQPSNPFLSLRTRAQLTLGELSTYSGIDRRALQRTEDGLYTNPLPTLVDYWVHKGHSSVDLLNDYEDYQLATRMRHARYFGPLIFPIQSTLHPFRHLRANREHPVDESTAPVGLIEACRIMCIPLDTVQYWEKKYALQQSVPKVVLVSLNQMGYSLSELREFKTRYKFWRDFRLTHQFNSPSEPVSPIEVSGKDTGGVGSDGSF